MFWLRACPRCNGDLHNHEDIYGGYIACLQCGHYLTVEEEGELLRTTLRRSLTAHKSAKNDAFAGAAA